MGDGKFGRELQIALDDTFNLTIDRMMLATVPTMLTKKYATEDELDIRIEPGHKISLEDPKNDLQWLELNDASPAANATIQFLRSMMSQASATWPTTMGDVPGLASTTATAVAGAEGRTNVRTNFRSLTFENTFLTDFYWMILQMTGQFAEAETALTLMGDKAYNFDPNKDYYYKPVSQAIETEQAKAQKVQTWTQILGYVLNIGHPDTPKLVNYILSQMFVYMGDEFVNFDKKLLNPEKPITQGPRTVEGGEGEQPPSNEVGIPQSQLEQFTREGS